MCRKPIITGIICEYNPFHNGHLALIEAVRRQGSTHIAVVMSGNFVQRGETACVEKGARVRMALLCGADLVLELPVPWAAARAETFAYGGVSLLHQLGCIDQLAFGSEYGQIEPFQTLANLLRSDEFQNAVSEEVSAGVSFARARQTAAAKLCDIQTASLLEQPNNILGIEYCKALQELGSTIQPCTFLRVGTGHDGTHPEAGYASASFLRARLAENPHADLSAYLPRPALDLLRTESDAGHLSSMKRLETAVLAVLRTLDRETLAQLPDISEGLENRLWNGIRQATTLDELYQLVKSKRYPHARVRRMVLAAFLGLREDDTRQPPPYVRVLGMNSRGMEILRIAKQTAHIPILSKSSQLSTQRIFPLECRATDLFMLSLAKPLECGLEQTRKVTVIH